MMRRLAAGVTAMLAAALIAGCAGIPAAGPVTEVEADQGFGESTVRYLPARPVKGASPEQVVRGYLDSMLAFPASTRTAEAFLTPEAAKEWSASSRAVIYSQPEVVGPDTSVSGRNDNRAELGSPVSVRLAFVEDARLDRQGHLDRTGRPADISYRLELVDGQWRIANPQPGVLVSDKFFDDYYRPFNLFYLDTPAERLVPDPVHLVVGEQLATSLVSSLVRGPRDRDRGATRTFAPPLDELRPSVPVSADGIADVEFTEDLDGLDAAARNRLSAQLVWTLRQVPGVTAVQIVGGQTSLLSGGESVQGIDAWSELGPDGGDGGAYAVVDDRVVQLAGGEVEPFGGPWGKDARGATAIAVSGSAVAGVLAGATRVRVTGGTGEAAQIVTGDGFIAPRWDDDQILWLVDRGAAGARVRLVDGTKVRTIDSGAIANLAPESFALSPDGARYALVADDRLRVGRVLRDAKDRIVGLGRSVQVPHEGTAPRSVSWSSGTGLTFLIDSEYGAQVEEAAIDGAVRPSAAAPRSGALLPDVDADVLALVPGTSPEVYATDARGRLWFLRSGGLWRQVSSDPVTGLASGR